jgi:adenine phosphoribosyltransferase
MVTAYGQAVKVVFSVADSLSRRMTPAGRKYILDTTAGTVLYYLSEVFMYDFDLDKCIKKVHDFPKKGILFYDITGILAEPKALNYCIDAMEELYRFRNIEAVAAIEARGFIFAAPFAVRMNIPLVLIRKKGKLPGTVISKKFNLEYGYAEIEAHADDIPAGKQILLMDDLIATGGTLNAARELLEEAGAIVPEIFGIIGLPFLHYEKILQNIPVRTLIQYSKE